MKHEINTEIKIEASRKEIWDVLMDFENYKEWNPFIEKIEGDPKIGNKMFVRLGGMSFRPKVKSNIECQEFSWLGRFILPGVFDGNHIFILRENEDNSITFISQRTLSVNLCVFKEKLAEHLSKIAN